MACLFLSTVLLVLLDTVCNKRSFLSPRSKTLPSFTSWTSQKCPISTKCTSCTTRAPSCSSSGRSLSGGQRSGRLNGRTVRGNHGHRFRLLVLNDDVSVFPRNKHIMIDLGTGNNNKINWIIEDKQEMIDIVETVYRGARKGRGLVVSPKDYSTKYRYWFYLFFSFACLFCSVFAFSHLIVWQQRDSK